jgi:hypothetical protein
MQFKKNGVSGGVFLGLYLTREGYDYLGANANFLSSMKDAKLNDPDVKDWEEGYQENIHAMLLIGDDDYDIFRNKNRFL